MKKLFVLLTLVFVAASCTTETNDPKFHFALLPVDSYVLPDSLQADQPYLIKVSYTRPATCYGFNDFYYQIDGTTRTIGIQNIVFDDKGCEPLQNAVVEKEFNFFATGGINIDSYTFKFYKGNGANGEALFETVVVPMAY